MIAKLTADILEESKQNSLNHPTFRSHGVVTIAWLRDFGELFLVLCTEIFHFEMWFYWKSTLSYVFIEQFVMLEKDQKVLFHLAKERDGHLAEKKNRIF